jgi:hypothetical protein
VTWACDELIEVVDHRIGEPAESLSPRQGIRRSSDDPGLQPRFSPLPAAGRDRILWLFYAAGKRPAKARTRARRRWPFGFGPIGSTSVDFPCKGLNMKLTVAHVAKALASLLATFMLATSGHATECKCRQHPAEAESDGTCSRTEDPNYCTLRFRTTPPGEYEEFVERLRKIGVGAPKVSLQFANSKPPQAWGPKEIEQLLPALFAMSQRTQFQDQTARIAEAIRQASKNENFVKFFASADQNAIKLKLGDFDATVSLGCVELNRGADRFYSMVKTPSSKSRFFCDDFQPH